MHKAQAMGVGLFVLSTMAHAAAGHNGCLLNAPVAAVAGRTQLQARFELALQGCGGEDAPAPVASELQSQHLRLYEDRLLPAPEPAAAAQPVAYEAGGDAPAVLPRGARVAALAPRVLRVAQVYGIDPLLLHAIAHVESRHNARAVSRAGALGLMQVMPATARRFGVTDPQRELLDADTNLEVSSAYLKTLQRRFDNDLTLVLAAYNAGEGAVEKHGRRVPPYPETRAYVDGVMSQYRALRATQER